MLSVEEVTKPSGALPDEAESEVVEIGILLLGREAAALERAAGLRGLTTGQAVRRLIAEFLRQQGPRRSADGR